MINKLEQCEMIHEQLNKVMLMRNFIENPPENVLAKLDWAKEINNEMAFKNSEIAENYCEKEEIELAKLFKTSYLMELA